MLHAHAHVEEQTLKFILRTGQLLQRGYMLCSHWPERRPSTIAKSQNVAPSQSGVVRGLAAKCKLSEGQGAYLLLLTSTGAVLNS
jgi:hypothetical protein